MKLKTFIYSFAFIIALLFSSCFGDDVNGIEDTIKEVKNGNTIVLSSGLTVHLNGLKRKNAYTEEVLNTYIGQRVALELDSSDEGTTVSSYEDEEVYCYVQLKKTGEDLSATLLKSGGEKAFDKSHCNDRKKEYESLVKDDDKILDKETLCSRMTASTMLVYAGNSRNRWIGTAFFIGDDGLALTNNHVLNHQSDGYVYLSNASGVVDAQQPFKIKRIVYTNSEYDFTIFYVDLDPTSLQRLTYLKIAKDRNDNFVRGAEIASIGNPAPGDKILTMSFATGEIAAFREEMGKIQINIPITHGFSGGPVSNFRGQVVGISQSGHEHSDANLNYAVDIRIVRAKLEELKLPYAGK